MVIRQGRKKTVKVLIFNKYGQLLLVHEKGERHGKPPGWGLPGGGVEPDETIEGIYKEIIALLREHAMFKNELLIYIPRDNPETLAVIRETLEETGFLVRVEREVLHEEKPENNHALILFKCAVIDGELKKSSVETDDSGWFFFDVLPEVDVDMDLSKAVYSAEKNRIIQAVENLGIREDLIYLREYFEKEIENEQAITVSQGGIRDD